MEPTATRTVKPRLHRIRDLFHAGGLSIRIRLIVCFVLIVLFILAADAVAVWQFRQISAASERLSNADQASHAIIRVHLDVDTFRDSMGALASSHDAEQFSSEAASIRRTFLRDVDQAEQALRATPDIEQDATVSDALESLRMTLLSQVDTAVQLAAAGEWSGIGSRIATQIPELIDYSSSLAGRVDQQVLEQRTEAIEETQQARQRLVIIVPIAAFLTLFAATALGWYVPRTITTPLSELTAYAKALARRDFQIQANVHGHDELAVLGEAFNHAARQLQHLYQLEADLAHMSRVSMMGELAASLTHEIKQPIGAAVTNAEVCIRLLDRIEPDVPDAREAALEMAKDARRAADIIDRVRSLYHKGSSQLELVDVNEVIAEMLIMLRNEANRRAVTMRADLADGLPQVTTDRVQLQQVLMNLMLNGIEAMGENGGELSIKSQLNGDAQLLISVTDAGVGLPGEDVDKIFNAFFTTKPQGTGMGLTITRSIVESHDGRIWATANSGRGTTFRFTLPIRTAVSA